MEPNIVTVISLKEIDDSTDGKSKSLVAYHEVGYAICGSTVSHGLAAQSADVIIRTMARNSMSEKLAEDIDSAIERISDEAYEIALTQIRNNRESIDKIVEVLLEKETITGDEFRTILWEFIEIPAQNKVLQLPH